MLGGEWGGPYLLKRVQHYIKNYTPKGGYNLTLYWVPKYPQIKYYSCVGRLPREASREANGNSKGKAQPFQPCYRSSGPEL